MTISEPAPRGEIVQERGASFEVFALPTDVETVLNVLDDCFAEWPHIRFGPLIPGALWEIRPPERPSITMLNGYATVDFNDWHFHICVGQRGGVDPEMSEQRRTSGMELYRRLNRDGEPVIWGLRLLNGAGDQQVTFLLPSPFLNDDQQELDEPDWGRLALWDRLRQRYLGIGPGPIDLTGQAARRG